MGVVCANIVTLVALHLLKANPDISLDHFQHIPQMKVSISIRER
jgi:hypothetical protein